ncbi:MAG: carboxypeptidase regulatory-like domain-containing protein, partial [Acidobacteria bacterium]|nr:carboxypeptidase regulatory-like domain-containing protein [Acidobacteriota bacterium]
MPGVFPPRKVVFLSWIAFCLPWAAANARPASWHGRLLDSEGRPLSDTTLVLRSTSGKTSYSTTSLSDGKFFLPAIASDAYELSVQMKGTTYRTANPVVIHEGEAVISVVRLSIERKDVHLTLSAPRSESQATGGEHLSSAEISSLPLNSRDFSKLLLLAAGTMTDQNGAANFTQQFAVNGQRGTATVFALDGSDATDPEMGGATFANLNVDAIEEVQASSGVMPPEIGHGAASYTNVVTKTGSDQVHGSVFEFVRNAAFDAKNYFDPPAAISHRRIPPFVRNEFGFTNGGPVVLPQVYDGRKRTFYFAEYQGFRQLLGTTQVFPVPTVAERQGIDTTTFPGDSLMVPVNPAMQPVLRAYPLPNTPEGPFGARTYSTSSKVSTTTDQFSLRVDHHISDKASLLARFSLNQVTGPLTDPDQTAIDPSFAVQFFDHQRNATVKYTRTVSPHLTSQTAVGYVRSTPFFPTPNHVQPAIAFDDGLFQSFNSPGGSVFGAYGNLYQLRQDMIGIRRSHTFKWGMEIRVNRDSTIFANNANGAYTFGGGPAYSPVFIPSASGTHNIQIGDRLPDSLLGLLTAAPYSYSIIAAAALTPTGNRFDEAGVRREAYDFYFADNWKANSRVSVNYGLRYEV